MSGNSKDLAVGTTSDEQEINRLCDSIDVGSLASVTAFGHSIGAKTAAYADDLLRKAKAGDLDDIGSKLNEIIASAQSFDLTSFDNAWARAPVVGPIVRRYAKTKERAMARFASVQTQVDKLVASVGSTADRLSRRSADFDAMFKGVTEEYTALDLHIHAGRRRLSLLDQELATRISAVNLLERETESALNAARAALEKRIADLTVLQHSAMQTLPMIRIMQANNLALIDKFQTIQRLTLPAWKRAFVMALTMDEQRDAGQLATNIDDATNYFMRRNAEVLHQNAVATAKSNQRLVIDIETLRTVHNEVVQTLLDVRAAHQEGAQDRSAALAALEDLRGRMAQGLLSSDVGEPGRAYRIASGA